jgi:beta-N-acetylhexosaminidase
MEGASVAGDEVARASAALSAGCDMALLCNKPERADLVLERLKWQSAPVSLIRFARMHGRPHPPSRVALHESTRHVNAVHHLSGIGQADTELALNDPTTPNGAPSSS